ncbi:MAG: class I SAM-dependent methyltransferase [Bacteroidota bacterium]
MVLFRCSYLFIFGVFIVSGCTNSDKKEIDSSDSAIESVIPQENDTLAFEELVQNYEAPDRGVWQNPELIIDQFGDLKGKIVADVGAGTGYFSFRLAADSAHVIAIDIDEQFLDYIAERKQELVNLPGSIATRLSVPDDPLLKDSEAHFVLIVNTYHFLSDRASYLKKLRKGLKENGSIIIVDFKSGKLPVGPLEEDKITIEIVTEELKKAGFSEIRRDTSALKYQFIINANR